MKSPELSIITVTYDNEDTITACLSSLLRISLSYEVLIIDNHSGDNTIKRVRSFQDNNPGLSLHLIANNRNRGFAAGVNQGLRKSRGKYILLLGPDASLENAAASLLIECLEQHRWTGLSAPRLENPDGSVQPSCRLLPGWSDLLLELSGLPRIFPELITPRWKNAGFDYTKPQEVQQPQASCLLIRRTDYKELGGMDERFDIFFNDVDWCRRFLDAGRRVRYCPAAVVQHAGGGSVYKHRIHSIWKSHQGWYRYLVKYSAGPAAVTLSHFWGLLLIIAAAYRSLLWLVLGAKSGKAHDATIRAKRSLI